MRICQGGVTSRLRGLPQTAAQLWASEWNWTWLVWDSDKTTASADCSSFFLVYFIFCHLKKPRLSKPHWLCTDLYTPEPHQSLINKQVSQKTKRCTSILQTHLHSNGFKSKTLYAVQLKKLVPSDAVSDIMSLHKQEVLGRPRPHTCSGCEIWAKGQTVSVTKATSTSIIQQKCSFNRKRTWWFNSVNFKNINMDVN